MATARASAFVTELEAFKTARLAAIVDAGRTSIDGADGAADARRLLQIVLAQGEAILPLEEPRQAATRVATEAFALAEALGDPRRTARAAVIALEALLRAAEGVHASAPAPRRSTITARASSAIPGTCSTRP